MVVRTSAFRGGLARTGNKPSWTPTTTMRAVPVTNSGIDEVETPNRTIARSVRRSRRLAARSPAAIEIGMVMSRARPAIFAELTIAAPIVGATGFVYVEDF